MDKNIISGEIYVKEDNHCISTGYCLLVQTPNQYKDLYEYRAGANPSDSYQYGESPIETVEKWLKITAKELEQEYNAELVNIDVVENITGKTI